MKKLVIIDGNAIVHRGFHAIQTPLKNSQGQLVNGVYGFTAMLMKVIKELNPDYMVAAFDLPKPTFRHKEYKEYKEHRVKGPDELYAQIPLSKAVLKAFGMPIFELEGYEADDILGTIAKMGQKEKDLQVIVATGDLDTLQLVNGNKVVVYAARKGIMDMVVYNDKAVQERYGLKPSQMNDYKGLRGDPSDNLPGVPGIGEKTASMLIGIFGSIEELYEHIDNYETKELSKKLGLSAGLIEKLKNGKDKAFLSKKLSTLVTDLPIKFNLQEAQWRKNLRIDVLERNLKDLGFVSLIKRLSDLGISHQGGLVLEGNVKIPTSKPAVPRPDEKNIYFIVGDGQTLNKSTAQDSKQTIIGHDLKESLKPLIMDGIEINCSLFDTKIAAYLLSPDSRDYDFHKIYYNYFQEEADDPDQKPAYLWRLRNYQWDQLKVAGLIKVFEDIELPLVKVLAEMELNGIKIDAKIISKLLKLANKEITQLEKQIYKHAGTPFNINSPKQLGEVLFNRLALTAKIRRTGGGALSTAASELEKLRELHPIIESILQYRELQKLRTTYIEPFPELIAKDGRIHTTYNQTVAGTGRLSSQDPNLQNIPVKTELGQEFRRSFIANTDCQLVSFDYSQIELRVVAHVAKDHKMIAAFNRGEDIHTRTAVEIFKVKPDQVTKEMRRQAKVLNFGIVYGMGSTSFARASGVDRNTAKKFITKYFEEFDGVARYMEETKQQAHRDGYVSTIFGRKRLLQDIRSTMPMLQAGAERAAINHPIQGTAADLVKLAMIKTHDYIHGGKGTSGVKMLLQVHDEVVCEIKKKDVPKMAKEIKKIMESIYNLDVPLIVDVKIGENWQDQKVIKI